MLGDGLFVAVGGGIAVWIATTVSLALLAFAERRARSSLGLFDLAGAVTVACASSCVSAAPWVAAGHGVRGLTCGLMILPAALLWATFYRHRAQPEVAALGASWFTLTTFAVGVLEVAVPRSVMLRAGAWTGWTALELAAPLVLLSLGGFISGLGRPHVPAAGVAACVAGITATWWDLRLFHSLHFLHDLPQVTGPRGPGSSELGPRLYRPLQDGNVAESSRGPRSAALSGNTPLADLTASRFLMNRGLHSFALTGDGAVAVDRREDGWHVGETGSLSWEGALSAIHRLPRGQGIEVSARRSITLQDLVDLCSVDGDRPCRVEGLPNATP